MMISFEKDENSIISLTLTFRRHIFWNTWVFRSAFLDLIVARGRHIFHLEKQTTRSQSVGPRITEYCASLFLFWVFVWICLSGCKMPITLDTYLPSEEELTVQEVEIGYPALKAGSFHLGKYCEAQRDVSTLLLFDACLCTDIGDWTKAYTTAKYIKNAGFGSGRVGTVLFC